MHELLVFERSSGQVGIRNNVFVISVVVCANQVVISTSSTHPEVKFVEHPHGCAQIGADLLLTRQVLGRLAHHPNVHASMYVSLGCEAVVAAEVTKIATQENPRVVDVISIQEQGGTVATLKAVDRWIEQQNLSAKAASRKPATWGQLTLGIVTDKFVHPNHLLALQETVTELRRLGVKLIVVQDTVEAMRSLSGIGEPIAYAAPCQGEVSVMEKGVNMLETLTGMAVSGAHMVIYFCDQPHAFGSPLVPVFQCGFGTESQSMQGDDYDFLLEEKMHIPQLLEQLAATISGGCTVTEEQGMEDFSIKRIGPSV